MNSIFNTFKFPIKEYKEINEQLAAIAEAEKKLKQDQDMQQQYQQQSSSSLIGETRRPLNTNLVFNGGGPLAIPPVYHDQSRLPAAMRTSIAFGGEVLYEDEIRKTKELEKRKWLAELAEQKRDKQIETSRQNNLAQLNSLGLGNVGAFANINTNNAQQQHNTILSILKVRLRHISFNYFYFSCKRCFKCG